MILGYAKEMLTKDEALGFVESLVSIAVAGMACVAFLSIAASVVREEKNNELRDAMKQYAVEGLEQVRWVSDENIEDIPIPNSNSVLTYCLRSDDSCSGGSEPFVQIDNGKRCSDSSIGKGACGRLSLARGGDPVFYREVDFERVGVSVKATVRVGLLVEGRNLGREHSTIGYIPVESK